MASRLIQRFVAEKLQIPFEDVGVIMGSNCLLVMVREWQNVSVEVDEEDIEKELQDEGLFTGIVRML